MTRAAPARINARLPPETASKVAYLERRTKMSTTEVVLASIDRYYATLTEGKGAGAEALAEAGFIACANGPSDLSSSYKSDLALSLEKKR
jgi:hypothetical protein